MNRTEWVVDSSVALKWYLPEDDADLARALVARAWLSAPDLILPEVAHVLLKRVRGGVVDGGRAAFAVDSISASFEEVWPAPSLTNEAFRLALNHGFSGYDAHYVAMAVRTGRRLVTADGKLARRAAEAGLGEQVVLLSSLRAG